MKEPGPAWEGEAGHRGEPLVWGEPLHHVLPDRRPRNNVAATFEQRDMPIGVSRMSPPSLFPDPGFSCPHRTPVGVLSPCRTADIGSLPWSPATHPCGPPPTTTPRIVLQAPKMLLPGSGPCGLLGGQAPVRVPRAPLGVH